MIEANEAAVILCKCGQTHRTYGIRVERTSEKKWTMTWAFPIKESTGKREGYDRTPVSGDVVMSSEYPGCPYCGHRSLTVCSCGHVSCTHTIGNIFTCEWCGSQGEIVDYTGGVITAGADA